MLNPEKIVNEVDSLTGKVLMVMIMVVNNMADTSHARRASLVHLFSILLVSKSRKRKTEKTELEEQNIYKSFMVLMNYDLFLKLKSMKLVV